MEKTNQIIIIEWLINRLIHKYGHSPNDQIVELFQKLLISIRKPYTIDMDLKSFDKIISRYYPDFLLEKTPEMNVGFSEQERNTLRQTMFSIVCDVVNKNIPEDFTIKG